MKPRYLVQVTRSGEVAWLRMNGRAVPALVRDKKDATAFLKAKADAWAALLAGCIWTVAP